MKVVKKKKSFKKTIFCKRIELKTMEHLEPWNMFTNDFVAEETDEILTPDCTDELNQELEEHRHEDGDDTIFNFELVPQKKNLLSTTRASLAPTPPIKAEENVQGDKELTNVDYENSVVYICPACGAEFDMQSMWKRHMNSIHNYNTRRGLNFVQIDKLYHECLECHKRIAMHSMENLMKHKFTHLPYRCTKCKVCLRQYKYRQDLMVHLRMTHRDDLQSTSNKTLRQYNNNSHNNSNNNTNNNISTQRQHANSTHNTRSNRSNDGAAHRGFEIKDIKENAIDIFENTFDNIEVKNELIEPDEETDDTIIEHATASKAMKNNSFVVPSFLEDALSRGSSHASERYASKNNDEEICEKHILYICPQCGAECETKSQWQQHIECVHDFGSRRGLNFQEVNMKLHAKCMECNRVLHVNVIGNLQQHKFTHLPHKWLRCKLCFNNFADHNEIVKHLMTQHRLGAMGGSSMSSSEYEASESQEAREIDDDDDTNDVDDNDNEDAKLLNEQANRPEDLCEQHIEYICPQCGRPYLDKKKWRRHIVHTHQLTDLQVLNFKVINEREVMCLECGKIITNAYGVQNAQQHRITHMPYKSYIRCRLCEKSYTDRKGLVKHLRTLHLIGEEPSPAGIITQQPRQQNLETQSQSFRQMQPQREIVKHANFIYEIQYLEEEDGMLMDDSPVPELSFDNSFESNKCADCGSIFPTQKSLRAHINKEHENPDFNYMTAPKTSYVAKHRENNHSSQQQKKKKLEQVDNEINDEQFHFSSSKVQDGSGECSISSIECHFCYMCPSCGVEYKTQMEWRRHINDVHNFDKRHYLNFRAIDKFRYQCTECHDIVSNSKLKGLQDHKFRHLPHKLYIKCLLCGTCYNHKPNMYGHLKVRHNIVVDTRTNMSMFERNYDYNPRPGTLLSAKHSNTAAAAAAIAIAASASASPEPTNSKPPGLRTVEDCISFHNAVDHESVQYFCPQCNQKFDTHVFWRKHIVDAHNLNSRQGLNFRQIDAHHYLCLQCYKRVTVTHTKGAIGQLQSHKFRHLPFKSFRCVQCEGEFVRKQMFFKHLNKVTNCCDSKPQANDVSPPSSLPPEKNDDDELIELKPSKTGALLLNQSSFTLICPQCNEEFDSVHKWREHINNQHQLGKRETLRFKRLKTNLHRCIDCGEHVNGKKLRDLQVHKFKHLSRGAYIHCRFCPAEYWHIRNMLDHLRHKHPNMVHEHEEHKKMEEIKQYEELSLTDTNDTNEIHENDVEEPYGTLENQPDYKNVMVNSSDDEQNIEVDEQNIEEDEEEEEDDEQSADDQKQLLEQDDQERQPEPDEQYLLG